MLAALFVFLCPFAEKQELYLNVDEAIAYLRKASHIEKEFVTSTKPKDRWAMNGLKAWATLEELDVLLDDDNPAIRAYGYLALVESVMDADARRRLERGCMDDGVVKIPQNESDHHFISTTIRALILAELSSSIFDSLSDHGKGLGPPHVGGDTRQPPDQEGKVHRFLERHLRVAVQEGERRLVKHLARFQDGEDLIFVEAAFEASLLDGLQAVAAFPHPSLLILVHRAWDGSWGPAETWTPEVWTAFAQCLTKYRHATVLEILDQALKYFEGSGDLRPAGIMLSEIGRGDPEFLEGVWFRFWEALSVADAHVIASLFGRDLPRSIDATIDTLHRFRYRGGRIDDRAMDPEAVGVMVDRLFDLDDALAFDLVDETLTAIPIEFLAPVIESIPASHLEELTPTLMARLFALQEHVLSDSPQIREDIGLQRVFAAFGAALCLEAQATMTAFATDMVRAGHIAVPEEEDAEALLSRIGAFLSEKLISNCRRGTTQAKR